MIVSTLFNGLWQGAPIVAIGYLLASLTPKRNAATRYALWFATLLALVVVPILTTASNAGALLFESFHARAAEGAYSVSLLPTGALVRHADVWFEKSVTWMLGAWLVGVAVNLVLLGASFWRIERIKRRARPLAHAAPDLFVSEDVAVPIVAGIFAPAILIPQALETTLKPADLARIVEHERAHVRRHDFLANLVARLIEAVLFFNPWVRLAASRVCEEREAACDDWVVESIGNPDDYAACLATLAQTLRHKPVPLLTPSALRSRRTLVSRIERLSLGERRRLTINAYPLIGAIMIFIVTTLALQALSPALALTPADASITGAPAASLVAAACANPTAEARVVTAAEPALPQGLKMGGTVNVGVTIAPNGHVIRTTILRSSGNSRVDEAAVDAARHSTYSPKRVNCGAVAGSYLFHVEFAPKG